MERKTVLTAVVLLGLLCASVAQAELYISTEFGNGADTYITNNPSGKQTSIQNWGTEVRMRDRSAANSRFMGIFLRFDLSGMSDPFAADTRLIMCTTFLKGVGKVMNIYGLANSDVDDYWIESGTGGITYATAPGFLTPAIGDNGATVAGNDLGNYAIDNTKLTLLGTITSQAAGASLGYCYSVTGSALADFLNLDGNGVATLVVIAQGNSEVEWATKENTTYGPPALVPEPATMLILGLGSLMVVRRKK